MKHHRIIMLAAAAMSFASCAEDAAEEIAASAPAPTRQTKTVTVIPDLTRTEFGASRNQLAWSANDEFGVYTDVASDKNIPSGTYADAAASDGAFSFEVDAAANKIYAYYPYSGSNDERTSTAVSFGVPDSQTWTGPGVFDGKNIPMAASGTIEGSNVNLSFEPLACVLALNVYGGATGETLSSITLSTAENSCSSNYVNLTESPVVYTPNFRPVKLKADNGAAAVAVDAPSVTDRQNYANQVYLAVAKKRYAKGATFAVTTSNSIHTYTFTTKAELDCTASDFKAINLNLANSAVTVLHHFSRENYNYGEFTSIADRDIKMDSNISFRFRGKAEIKNRFVYVREARLTIKSSNGKVITGVKLHFSSTKDIFTANKGTYTPNPEVGVWTGRESEIVFTATSIRPADLTVVMYIAVTYE